MDATRRFVMENEMIYDVAITMLNQAINSGLIDETTYEILLEKLNEKLYPLVPKKTSFIR